MKKHILLTIAAMAAFAASAETLSVGGYEEACDENNSERFVGSNWYNAPIIPTYKHSGVQMLYTADELAEMADSEINSLKFKFYCETYVSYSSNITVFLQETDATEFEYAESSESRKWFAFDKENPTAATTFERDFYELYYLDGELEISLAEKPFAYSGKNLVVTVVNESEDYINSSDGAIAFYCYTANTARNANFSHDTVTFFENLDKDGYVNSSSDHEFMSKELPVVQFGYKPREHDGIRMNHRAESNVARGSIGSIVLELANDAKVDVFNMSGQAIASVNGKNGNSAIAVPAGLYLVRIGDAVQKIHVK